ncbi:MAG: SCO family protein, partial [Proteobacteria bacterium]|nr:SCO family protein [Pseudomonadota bacterium]
ALALTDLVGQRVILSMAYTRCHHTCPTTFNELQRMQQQLDARGEQASFVIVGYDATGDDPRSWRDYRRSRRLNRSNWHFLTGSERDVHRLARQLGFDFWNYDTHVMHDSRIVFFDGKGRFSGAVSPASGDWAALL